jgi:hypothetical protein
MRVLPSYLAVCVLASGTAAPTRADTHGPAGGSDCADLAAIPLDEGVAFIEVQTVLINRGCIDCHLNPNEFPFLDLRVGSTPDSLVGVSSSQNADYVLVEPGAGAVSLLFTKVNCGFPPVGSQMPLAGTPIPQEEQALIFDWIEAGALGAENSPYLLKSGFESRR